MASLNTITATLRALPLGDHFVDVDGNRARHLPASTPGVVRQNDQPRDSVRCAQSNFYLPASGARVQRGPVDADDLGGPLGHGIRHGSYVPHVVSGTSRARYLPIDWPKLSQLGLALA